MNEPARGSENEPGNGLASPHPAGCVLVTLDGTRCEQYFAWVLGEQSAEAAEGVNKRQTQVPEQDVTGEQPAALPEGADGLVWCLAHCDDGVTWGRYDVPERRWRLGSEVVPAVSPSIRREALQELRIFGNPGEVLIWRAGAELRGRVLRDAASPAGADDPLRPSDERRILRGDAVRLNSAQGFTHIADRVGAEQVLPLTVSDGHLQRRLVRLRLRHYWEADAATGAVRIAATRLVGLRVEGSQ